MLPQTLVLSHPSDSDQIYKWCFALSPILQRFWEMMCLTIWLSLIFINILRYNSLLPCIKISQHCTKMSINNSKLKYLAWIGIVKSWFFLIWGLFHYQFFTRNEIQIGWNFVWLYYYFWWLCHSCICQNCTTVVSHAALKSEWEQNELIIQNKFLIEYELWWKIISKINTTAYIH